MVQRQALSNSDIFSEFYTVNMVFGDNSFTVAKVITLYGTFLSGREDRHFSCMCSLRFPMRFFKYCCGRKRLNGVRYLGVAIAYWCYCSGDSGCSAAICFLQAREKKGMVRRYRCIFALSAVFFFFFFPTVMSAMVGHIALSTPYVKLEDKAFMPWF